MNEEIALKSVWSARLKSDYFFNVSWFARGLDSIVPDEDAKILVRDSSISVWARLYGLTDRQTERLNILFEKCQEKVR